MRWIPRNDPSRARSRAFVSSATRRSCSARRSAISVQSARANAYDQGDLELLSAIGNEAAIAIERADLYERTTALSRRLFELHRLGVVLAEHKELGALVKAFTESVESLMRASTV